MASSKQTNERPESGDSPTLQRLTESVQEVAQGHYDSANRLFQVASSETEAPEWKNLAETLGLMCVKVEGCEYQLELMMEELKKKKDELENQMLLREEAGFMFTTSVVVLCLYFVILYCLVQAGLLNSTARSCMMLEVIVTILTFSGIHIARHHRPWRDWGFTWADSGPSLRLLLLTGLPLAMAGILWKWFLIRQPDSTHFGRPLFEAVSLMAAFFYIPVAWIQEVISRGILQTLIERLLPGRRASVVAIIVSSMIFAVMHLYYSPITVWVTWLASVYFGWLYYRHRTLVGVFAAHYLLGLLYVFSLRLIAW